MDEARHCAVCGRVLEHVIEDASHSYRHAAVDLPEDHPPVAVRHSENPSQVQYRCDFCLAEPVTHTLVVDHEITFAVNAMVDPEWAMCETCTHFVMQDDWEGLQRHAFAAFEANHGRMPPLTKFAMIRVYREIRRSVVMVYKEEDGRTGTDQLPHGEGDGQSDGSIR